ncbi:helix-turn-helix transcriptional regulator [Kytococcus sp. HMSC28H12]|uniref:ArsR/SmtB family transcription factor n=1 Tax=Kytococcus sp. HMSC28H12 TaxID=1581067 RepID=UPI0008A392BC|nr:helix-turn-helix domain-containing protein [Kytococcus sp. HMSC28H12]OFS15828.1 transcriptional regulator [Kytococcus sp. HMSC28H12]
MTPRRYVHPDAADLSLARVLAALSDSTRLEMVRRLSDGMEHDSLDLADDLPRSTLTYHTRMLREAGVTWTRGEGRACLIRLRRDDLDALFPGVLGAVIDNVDDPKQAS